MPILEVQIVGDLPISTRAGLAQRLADVAGAVLSSRPQGTWVKLASVPETDYAESSGSAGILPVFVTVLKREVTLREALCTEIDNLTQAIATVCGRPAENIHIIYEAPAAGRIAFGGTLVE